MIESLPDFEAQTAPEAAPPARKPRRKPQKRRSTPPPTKTHRVSARGKVDSRKVRGKIDKRTKAYRDRHKRVEEAMQTYQEAKNPHPVAGQAQAVLAVLAAIAGYEPAVRREILAKAGTLA